MDFEKLNQIIGVVSQHGYWFIFLAMIFEGPVVTIATSFASALGFFNVYTIFTISFLADVVADVVYYAMGYWGRLKIIEKYGSKFGFGTNKIQKIERLLKQNAFTTIAALKITPGLATPGLIIAGASKLPLKKYFTICLSVIFPRTILFVALGYYAGIANVVADKYLHYGQYALVIAAVGIIAVSYAYKKISQAIARKIEKM